MNFKCKLRQYRYDLRYLSMQYPPLYLLLTRFGDQNGVLVDSETEITIEGFPRSANTFAVNAFRLAQQRPIKIAHHKHSTTQFLFSKRLQIPALLVIRSPEDAVISFLIREPCISLKKALQYWIFMYQRLWQYRSDFVIADFEEITIDFSQVIKRINLQFHTKFALFDHNDENVEKCFSSMENYSKNRNYNTINETLIPRPSLKRQDFKKKLKENLRSSKLYDLRQSANDIYKNYLNIIKTY